ncbi:STAS domain-containing protein [Streptomyces sp. NPDC058417]|uniref:STAS domain-containing protein n=1 Tax=unclassified Streptomyces TaxID=2593676 RepID=UPI00364B8F24
MTTELTVTTGPAPGGGTLLAVAGEIDMSNSGAFAAALDAPAGRLVVDLTAVEYLDSAGLSVLFARAERVALVAGPLLRPVLTVSGLASLTTVRWVGD